MGVANSKNDQLKQPRLNMISKKTAEKSNWHKDWKIGNMATANYEGLKSSLNGQ